MKTRPSRLLVTAAVSEQAFVSSQLQETNTAHNSCCPNPVIQLKPKPGSLNIEPTIAGTEIVLSKKEADKTTVIGIYTDRINNVEIEQGRYQVIISKVGFKKTTREFEMRAAGFVQLEPPLEPALIEGSKSNPTNTQIQENKTSSSSDKTGGGDVNTKPTEPQTNGKTENTEEPKTNENKTQTNGSNINVGTPPAGNAETIDALHLNLSGYRCRF